MNNRKAIKRYNNEIVFYQMNYPYVVSAFLREMYMGIERGYSEFTLVSADPMITVYPNACLPISSLIEFYKKKGIVFTYDFDPNSYLNNCGFASPYILDSKEIADLDSPFDRIIKYDSPSQVAAFTQKCVDNISHQVVCEEGIFPSLIWCINEVMDNVLVHSKEEYGYVLAQFHPSTKHIAICVADTGIGIYNSLRKSKHRPSRAIDALSLSIQEGVGDGAGQGNGLFGLYQIITENGGRLSLTSGPASLMLSAGKELKKYDDIPYLNKDNQCTIVDFQLDLNKKVDINTAFSTIGGFDGFDIRIDDMLQEDDALLYDVFSNCEGTATREAGKLLRNDVINTIKRTNNRIVLDFSNVKSASSSFLDEFLAKLVLDLGIITFCQTVKLTGMDDTIKYLSERSMYMRIFQEWGRREIPAAEEHRFGTR
ncbi:MAG: DUF4325 domain-containing protein [Oscillospiraceae bacterium]|nr:DUF4325 domain-containing protein [Oscillospiraceae bacterium]